MYRQPINDLDDDLRGPELFFHDSEFLIAKYNLPGDQVKNAFAEIYPPANLFPTSVLTLPEKCTTIQDWVNIHSGILTLIRLGTSK